MKTKHLKIGLALITATITMVLYNNFNFANWQMPQAALESVNEKSRVSHAKELLGSHYDGSLAQRLEGQELNQLIYQKVQMQLAPKWKGHAAGIAKTVINEASRYNLDPIFVLAVIRTESRFNPVVVGSAGEIGLMQIKPDTAEWIAKKFKIPWNGKQTLENPSANIKIGLAYMNYLRHKFDGKAVKYVSAYNMGPKNVRRLLANNVKPAEYNSRVMKNYGEFYTRLVQPTFALVASN